MKYAKLFVKCEIDETGKVVRQINDEEHLIQESIAFTMAAILKPEK
jgi:hypothetical protein